MRDPLADALVAAERRLLSLERRFRDFAAGSVRYLHQLLDVDITYDGPSAVADGDVLTYDGDTNMWVSAPPSGGGGVAGVHVRSEWDGSTWSHPDAVPGETWERLTRTPGALYSDGSVPAVAFHAGVSGMWHVSIAVASITGAGMVGAFSPQYDMPAEWETGGPPPAPAARCLTGLFADQVSSIATVTGFLPLAEGDAVTMWIDGSISAMAVTVTAHLAWTVPVLAGDCGG